MSGNTLSYPEALIKVQQLHKNTELHTDVYKSFVKHFFPTLDSQQSGGSAVPWSRFDKQFSQAYRLGDLYSSLIQHCILLNDKRTEKPWLTHEKETLTHTTFTGRKLNVTGVRNLLALRKMMAQDLSNGVVVFYNEIALNDSFPVFFDIDLHVQPGREWLETGPAPSWQWFAQCVGKCVAMFYPGASDEQLRVVVSRSAATKVNNKVKTPAHIVCPQLICSREDMCALLPMLHQKLYEDLPFIEWESVIDVAPYRSSKPCLRPNGSFKATTCLQCKEGSHDPSQPVNCVPCNGNHGIIAKVYNDGSSYVPYSDNGVYSCVDLLQNNVTCYTIRMILNADGSINDDLLYARRPGPLSADEAWLEELTLTSLHVLFPDEYARFRLPDASAMPVPLLKPLVQRQLGITATRKLHPTVVKQAKNWERYNIQKTDPRAQAALECVRSVRPEWSKVTLGGMHIDRPMRPGKTKQIQKAFIFVTGTGSNFCLNNVGDTTSVGAHHRSNRVYFVLVHTARTGGATSCQLLQRCFCDCEPTDLNKRRNGQKCSTYQAVLKDSVSPHSYGAVFGGDSPALLKRSNSVSTITGRKRANVQQNLDKTCGAMTRLKANPSATSFFQ